MEKPKPMNSALPSPFGPPLKAALDPRDADEHNGGAGDEGREQFPQQGGHHGRDFEHMPLPWRKVGVSVMQYYGKTRERGVMDRFRTRDSRDVLDAKGGKKPRG
ncbi:hypothetical protein LZ554_001766 [Drepanopeziza brunnea f. sp. 'monogermtubi']|nr:hypothetical protein LZ554_001766 [Drepanopeziza brunnea f. sp. 'monogermtubi']